MSSCLLLYSVIRTTADMYRAIKLNILFLFIAVQLPKIMCQGNEPTLYMDFINIPSSHQTAKLFSKSKKGTTGEWVDSFAALTNTSSKSSTHTLEVTHKTADCGERRIVYLQGILNSEASKLPIEKLTFHPKTGKNVAILNNGRTAQKINVEDASNAVAFTKRPLRDNEIFEIILEKKHNKFSNSLGLGLCTSSPEDITITPHMWTSPIAWMIHHDIIYNNGKEILKPYGENIDKLKVGDRVGVMRSEYGAIHFFVNGVDQGPAVSNVPKTVYGVLDLYQNAAKATIKEAESENF